MADPVIERERRLKSVHQTALSYLMKSCREAGYAGVAYPVSEDGFHYLLWTEVPGQTVAFLVGALAILPLKRGQAECIAVVHPDYRRRGYFSRLLLPAAEADFSETEFFFPLQNPDPGTLSAVKSIGAEYNRTEYKMEKPLSSSGRESSCASSKPAAACDLSSVPRTFSWPPSAAVPYASCRLARVGRYSVCLYNVKVRRHLRNRGVATQMIEALSEKLSGLGVKKLLVHVSKSNLPAVALYTKTGFRITETLSYYLF